MPQRVNPIILLGLIIGTVLSFGLSAGAQPEDGAQEGDTQGAEPVDGSGGAAPEDDAVGEARSELERLRKEVQAADAERGKAADKKEQIADGIADTQSKLAAAEERSGEAERKLEDAASDVYKKGELDVLLGVVLGTETSKSIADRLGLAGRLLAQRGDVVKEANEAEDELTSELRDRQEQFQAWEATVAEYETLEEQARQAETDAKAYLDRLDEGIQEEIEAEQDRQAELDRARSEKILEQLEEAEPSAVISTEDLAAAQATGEKLAQLSKAEREAEGDVAEKVVEAEQQAAEEADRTGLDAEQAATEAATKAEAAEQARLVAEQDAAMGRANTQAAMKEAEQAGSIEVSNDTNGVVDGEDKLLVEGDFSIDPAATVTFQDDNGTKGIAINNFNADIVEGSIETTPMAPLQIVEPGDDGQLATEGLEVVDTTGIDAGREFFTGQNATGLQYAPATGAAGGLQYDPMITGAAGHQDDPMITEAAGLQNDPMITGVAGLKRTPAASGQPGLQQSAPAGGSASGGAALGIGAGLVGMPYAFGTDGPKTFSCTGLIRHILRSLGLPEGPWDHHAYLSQYPTVSTPAPGDVVVYPDGVAMYAGDNTVLMANEVDGRVGYYPMDGVGTPLGFARPYP